MALGAILAGAQTAMEFGTGLFQLFKGSGMNPVRPDTPYYEKSKSIGEMVSMNRNLLTARSTGSKLAEQKIAGNQANQVHQIQASASNPAQALAMINTSGNQANAAYNQLAVHEDEEYRKRQARLERALQLMSEEERRAFQFNELLPYQAEMQDYQRALGEKSRLIGGGLQNLHSGIGNAAGIAEEYTK